MEKSSDTADRRMERGLIAWYEELVADLPQRLPTRDPGKLVAIAAALDIRGYGPIKEKAVSEVKARVQDLLAQPDGKTPRAALVA